KPMAVAEAHPRAEDLAGFTLGTLDESSLASVASHVAGCPSCQERAAVSPGDSLVELLRHVHAQSGLEAGTIAEAAQAETPVPVRTIDEAVTVAPALAGSGEADTTDAAQAGPREFARHERYRVVRLLGQGGMGAVYEA